MGNDLNNNHYFKFSEHVLMMHKCDRMHIHALIQSSSSLTTVYPDYKHIKVNTMKSRKITTTRSFEQRKSRRVKARRGGEVKRRSSTKTRNCSAGQEPKTKTCSAGKPPEPASISIALLAAAESTSGNVLEGGEHVKNW